VRLLEQPQVPTPRKLRGGCHTGLADETLSANEPIHARSRTHTKSEIAGADAVRGGGLDARGLALLAVLWLHLLPALLAGLLVYELVHLTAPLWQRHLSNERARMVAVSALAVLVVGLVTALVTWLVVYLRGEGQLTRLLQKMAQIINQARATLPASVTENCPITRTNCGKPRYAGWNRTLAACRPR